MINQSRLFFLIILVLLMMEQARSWCLKTQFADSMKINSIDFSRDGSKIVTASDSFRVTIWDAHTL